MIEITHQKARSLIQAIADHRLPPGEKLSLDAHLVNCMECSDYASELSELEKDLRKVLHVNWDEQQPALNLQKIITPSPFNRFWNNAFVQPGIMGKATVVAALLLGYFFISNIIGIQLPISVDQTATSLPTPNEMVSIYSTSPTPSAQFTLVETSTRSCESFIYLVRENDTLESIAVQNKTTREAIIEYNHLTSDIVFAGEELAIPMCESTPSHTATIPERTITITPINGTYFPTQPQ